MRPQRAPAAGGEVLLLKQGKRKANAKAHATRDDLEWQLVDEGYPPLPSGGGAARSASSGGGFVGSSASQPGGRPRSNSLNKRSGSFFGNAVGNASAAAAALFGSPLLGPAAEPLAPRGAIPRSPSFEIAAALDSIVNRGGVGGGAQRSAEQRRSEGGPGGSGSGSSSGSSALSASGLAQAFRSVRRQARAAMGSRRPALEPSPLLHATTTPWRDSTAAAEHSDKSSAAMPPLDLGAAGAAAAALVSSSSRGGDDGSGSVRSPRSSEGTALGRLHQESLSPHSPNSRRKKLSRQNSTDGTPSSAPGSVARTSLLSLHGGMVQRSTTWPKQRTAVLQARGTAGVAPSDAATNVLPPLLTRSPSLPHLDPLKLTPRANKRHRRLEKSIERAATLQYVSLVSWRAAVVAELAEQRLQHATLERQRFTELAVRRLRAERRAVDDVAAAKRMSETKCEAASVGDAPGARTTDALLAALDLGCVFDGAERWSAPRGLGDAIGATKRACAPAASGAASSRCAYMGIGSMLETYGMLAAGAATAAVEATTAQQGARRRRRHQHRRRAFYSSPPWAYSPSISYEGLSFSRRRRAPPLSAAPHVACAHASPR